METTDQNTLKLELIEKYKNFIRETKNEDENYKWDAIDHFRKTWDIEAPDFGAMVADAFKRQINLFFHSSRWFLNIIAKNEPAEAREMFRHLFDDGINLKERMKAFQLKSEILLSKIRIEMGRDNLQHGQDEHTISVYLAFHNPDKYYLYKNSVYKDYCNFIGEKSKSAGDKYQHFTELADSFKNDYLLKDPELLQLHKELHPNLGWDDTNLITQNILYRMLGGLGNNKIKGMPIETESQTINEKEELISVFKSIGSKSVVKTYFDCIYHAFRQMDVKEGDPRFEYTVNKKSNRLTVQLDHRYFNMIERFKDKINYSILISPKDIGQIEKNEFKIKIGQFNTITKNEEPPLWAQFSGKPQNFPFITQEFVNNGLEYELSLTTIQYRDAVKKSNKEFESCVFDPEKLDGLLDEIFPDIINEPGGLYERINYYWLNANPKMWSLNDLELKPEIDYTTHTETGTKRRIYKYMQAVKPGDKVIGYETSPVKKVRALMEVTKSIYENEAGQEVFDMKLVAFTPQQPTWDELKALPALQNSEVIQNMQGSLFKLTKEEYEAIVELTKTKPRFDHYSKEDLLKDVFITPEKLDRTLALLQRKKNIILQGPPGTGKTYFAKRLAWCMMGEKDPTRVRTIQFHQSYSYEDFIQGYRPEDGGLKLKNGVFYDFAKQASRDKDRDYVMIIDEINRGNLSKIFGELMLLIEADKRDQKIKLAYSRDDEEFSVPPNLHIIGTMNTADRSLALVDYALRRRFAFITMTPHFENHFIDHLNFLGFEGSFVKNLIAKINHINGLIMGDSSLKEGFLVGHSYFVTSEIPADPDQWLNDIFNYEILPLLEEYWFDDQDRLSDIRTILGLSK